MRAMLTKERLAEEAERMRRVPGIYFGEESDGRRAKVSGTGIDVWEIVRDWQAWGSDFDELCHGKDWLAPEQLRAALNYYALFSEEIDRYIWVDAKTAEILEKYTPLVPPWPATMIEEFKAAGLWEDRT
jgi:uncharacterized protein (DUF433 family)